MTDLLFLAKFEPRRAVVLMLFIDCVSRHQTHIYLY
jgi:hypothetical protein